MFRLDFTQRSGLKLVAICSVIAALCRPAVSAQVHDPAVLRGHVLNETAGPIANARVDISTAAPRFGPSLFCPSCYLDCQKWTTTDRTGKFEITGLDPSLKFRIVVSAAGYSTIQTALIEPDEDFVELKLQERPKTIDDDRVIRGFVRNDLGIAVSGALVTPVATISESGLRTFSANGIFAVVSDATGHFEIDLVGEVSGIDVEVTAEGLCPRRFVGLVPHDDRKHFDLSEGVRIVGSVARDGQPVPGMTVSVAQTDRGSSGEKFFLQAIPAVTDAEGRFELKNLPPDQEYCVYSVIGEANRSNSAAVLKTQKFNAPSSGKTIDIGKLSPTEPVSFSGRILQREEAPLEETFLLFKRDPAWDLIKVPVSNDGTFRIDGLPPEVYEISLSSSRFELDADRIDSLLWTEKSLKRVIDKSIDDFELPIRQIERNIPDVEPNGKQKLTGRVTISGDKGLAGIYISASDSVEALGKGLGNGVAPWATTSSDGHFALTALPDMTVWLKLYKPDEDGMRFWYLGMVKPALNAKDFTIPLGPEFAFELNELEGHLVKSRD